MKKQLQKFRLLNLGRLLLLTMIIFIGQGAAFSQGIKTVTTNADDGAGSLRQIIADAVDGDVINFDGAITTITVESTLNLGDKTLTIDGGGDLILERNVQDLDSFRIVTITGAPDKVVTLENLTIQGGYSKDHGGGLYADNTAGGLTILENLVIKNNTTVKNGGGAFTKGFEPYGNIVNNCEFIGNKALHITDGRGGALYPTNATITGSTFTDNECGDSGGAIMTSSNVAIEDSHFTGNKALDDSGGAVRIQGADSYVTNCTFESNSANRVGGAMFMAYGIASDCEFINNSSIGNGGAISVNNYAEIHNSLFSGNSTGDVGGAVYMDDNGLIANCIATNNSAAVNGGGFYLKGVKGPTLLIGSVIANNKADSIGGGVYVAIGKVINSTITKNYAAENGGALSGDGNWYIANSIVYDNDAAGENKNIQIISNTAIEHAANSAIDATGYNAASWVATNITTLNSSPFIGGSEADSLMLPIGSSLIDAGDTTGISALLPETDLNGIKRVISVAIDLGVYERYVSMVVTTDADAGAGSLRQVIADALDGETLITFADGITTIKVDQPLELGDKTLIIDGGDDVVLDGSFNADPALDIVRVMTITGSPDKMVTVKNLTIQNSFEKTRDGGGLYADHTAGGKTVLENIVFKNNTAFRNGGGLYLKGLSTDPSEVINCEFLNNYVDNLANEGDGGGMWGAFCIVSGCTFTDNEAKDDAGAIYANSEVKISNSTFTGNLAGDAAGAIRTGNATIVISDCLFDSNSATTGPAGAVFMARGSVLNSEFVNNTAATTGGAVSTNNNECIIDNSIFTGNSSAIGGAVYVDDGGMLSNLIIKNNTAGTDGGGLYLSGIIAAPTVVGCVIANNTATAKGGGIYVLKGNVINSTITQNYAGTNGGALTGDTGPWFIANSIVFGNDAAGADKNIEFVSNSATAHAANSAIDATAYNNTWTATNIIILDASPFVGGTGADSLYSANFALVDAGTLDFGIADVLPEFDLDGNNRIQGTVDMGVYETEKISVIGVSLDRSTLKVNVGGTGTLVAIIEPSFADNRAVIWTSSNESVATVDGGVVTGISTGSATITVTTVEGSFTAACEVTVTVAVTGVTLDQTAVTLDVDETVTLVATLAPADATNQTIGWVSGDESVATVKDGLVTAISPGTATISVVTLDGSFIATCQVTVNDPTIGIEHFKDGFKIYPNPVKDNLIIEGENILSVTIYSVIGTPVMFVEEGVSKGINVSAIESGMYFLKITTDKGTAVKTIIKE